MCRLFGFRSVIQSQVHRSLVSAENALGVQAEAHPDGWGVAYYLGGSPHLIKSAQSAISDRLFHRVSGVVSSETVVAHVRKATQGILTPINCHPFQFGSWIFAHNGNIAGFDGHREELAARIPPGFRRFILGQTDSELLFYLLISHMDRRGDVHARDFPLETLRAATEETLSDIASVVGPYETDPNAPPTETFLTFLVTNGRVMLGHQGGKPLYFSTYKQRCPERDSCPSFAPECEMISRTGYVNHLIFSSEPLQGENIWIQLTPGEMVGVGPNMKLHRFGWTDMAALI